MTVATTGVNDPPDAGATMWRVSSQPGDAAEDAPPIVFRESPLVVLVALVLAVCVTPVAFAAPLLWLLYLVPIGVVAWTLRVRTTVDPEAVTVRRVVGGRRVTWHQISSLRLRNRGRVSAVLTDGAELPLPAVHVRNLPLLAAASGGRLPDPAGE